MTANQIAWYEAREGKRHNEAQEDIAREANAIEERKAQWTAEYNRDMLAMERDYKQAYIAYLNADAEHKWQYQDEMVLIEQHKAMIESEYKAALASIEQDKVALTASWNTDQKQLQLAEQQIQRAKMEFEKSKWNEERELRSESIELERLKFNENKYQFLMNQTYDYKRLTLQTQELNLQTQQFQLDMLRANTDMKLKNSQIWNNYLMPAVNLLGNTMHNGSQLLLGNLRVTY